MLSTEVLAEQREAKQRVRLLPWGTSADTGEAIEQCKYVTHEQLKTESRRWSEMLFRELDRVHEQRLDTLLALSELRADLQTVLSKETDSGTTPDAHESSSPSPFSEVDMSNAGNMAKTLTSKTRREQYREVVSFAQAAVADLRHNVNMQWERHDDLIADLRETVFAMQQKFSDTSSQPSSTDVGHCAQDISGMIHDVRSSMSSELKDESLNIRKDLEPLALQLSTLERMCGNVGSRLDESCQSFANSFQDITTNIQDIYKRLSSEDRAIADELNEQRNHEEVSKQALRIDALELLVQSVQKRDAAEASKLHARFEAMATKLSPLIGDEIVELHSRIEVVEVSCRDRYDALAQRIDSFSSHASADEATKSTAHVSTPEKHTTTRAVSAPLPLQSSRSPLEVRMVSIETRLSEACTNLGADLRLSIAGLEDRVSKLESCLLETAQVSLRFSSLEHEVKKQSTLVLSIVEDRKREETMRTVGSGMSTVAMLPNTSSRTIRPEDMTNLREESTLVRARYQELIPCVTSTSCLSKQPSGPRHTDNPHGNSGEPAHTVTRQVSQQSPRVSVSQQCSRVLVSQQSSHVSDQLARPAATMQGGVAQGWIASVTPGSPAIADREMAESLNIDLRTPLSSRCR